MELSNTFTVPVPVDEAWRAMLDVEKVAPCMPGATIDEVQGDDVLGRVRVKLGPVSITYQGKVTFAEKDEEKHRLVLNAAARETRGSGTANARITAAMNDADGSTEVSVTTDLNVTGRPAQFGRGVMSDVSERIMNEFAANLARELDSGRLGPAPASATAPSASAASLDLLDAAGAPVLKRLAPVLAALLALAGVLIARRATKGRS